MVCGFFLTSTYLLLGCSYLFMYRLAISFQYCARLHTFKIIIFYFVLFFQYESVLNKYLRRISALNEIPSQSYMMSLAIRDHTVLPATRHK